MSQVIIIKSKSCRVCGKTIPINTKEHISRYLKKRACSMQCAGKLKTIAINRIPRYCEICNVLIHVRKYEPNSDYNKRKFCSIKCFRNRGRKWIPLHNCLHCEKPIIMKDYHSGYARYRKQKFCSQMCLKRHNILGDHNVL